MPSDGSGGLDVVTATDLGNDTPGGTTDTASPDGSVGDGPSGRLDTAGTDGPARDGGASPPDAVRIEVSPDIGADRPGDSPVGPDPDASHGDAASLPTRGFRRVATGGTFSCALGSDDGLWCWGGNLRTTTANRLDADLDWRSLDLGGDAACAIRKNGTLWCWGTNAYQQLGLGDASPREVTVPSQVGSGSDWQRVSMGLTVACGVRGAGTLWCWGTSSIAGGEVGDGSSASHAAPIAITQASDWTEVSAGETHTCGLRAPGALWCWGKGSSGQLGLGTDGDRFAPQPIASKIPARVGDQTDWTAVSAGGSHTCGLRGDGTLWCWGSNLFGQLGTAVLPLTNAASPSQVGERDDWVSVSAGSQHTCARRADKSVWCWGNSLYGQVGAGGQATVIEPTRVGSGSGWDEVQSGGMHTCGVKDDTSLWCWGRNHAGQLGIGSLPVHDTMTRVGEASDWDRVITQGVHTCGLRAGTLWCWGQNPYGAIGDGTTENRQQPTRVGPADDWISVVVGQWHTCGLRADHTLWCWGANGDGMLGIGQAQTGTTGIATTPMQVGAEKAWVAVDAALHTCALASDGSLWCWGQNTYKVLSPSGSGFDLPTRVGLDDDWIGISVDTGRTCGLRADHSVWCWGYGLSRDPARIGDAFDWRTVSADAQLFCGIKTEGSLWCGNLGGLLERRGEAADWIEASPICGVRASGALVGGLGRGPGAPLDTATDWKTCGGADPYVCAVKKDGTLWCKGSGLIGEMGHGDAWRTTPAQVFMAP